MHPSRGTPPSPGVLLIWLLCVVSGARTEGAQAENRNRTAESTGFFAEPTLRTFQFKLSDASLNQLRQAPRSYVTGQLVEGRQVFTNVGLRLRGSGSFRSLEDRPNLTLKLDQFATNQSYRGLKKLHFNNSIQDETRLAEFVSTQLFRDAGLPAARVTHARVLLNGRDLGVYVAVEPMTRAFLKRSFNDASGNLYEGSMADVDAPLQQDSGVSNDQSDRARLARACALTNLTERGQALSAVLDVDRFISFAAMEMLTAHWDGYVIHTNNFRLYHNPTTDRFTFIPHGMDWTFMRPQLSIEVPEKTVVARALFQTREGRQLYRARVGTLFTNVFRVDAISRRIEDALAKIRTGEIASNDLACLQQGAALMRERVAQRAASVSKELAGSGPAFLALNTNGLAALTQWRAYHDGGTGVMDRVTIDGRSSLHIGSAGACLPSWRSLVYLGPGSYRFEGMVKVAAPGELLVMLRTSGPAGATTWNVATDWRPLSYDFVVQDAIGNDVEFVCDFRASAGEAWFDLASLKVRRLAPP